MNGKLKKLFSKESNGEEKKKIENLVVLVLVIIITVVAINYIWNGNKKENKIVTEDSTKKLAENKEEDSKSDDLEMKLENILAKIRH